MAKTGATKEQTTAGAKTTPPNQNAALPQGKTLSEKFVPGQTKCRVCGDRLFVRHTEKTLLSNGDILISRSVKCGGYKRHCYQMSETIHIDRKEKTQKETQTENDKEQQGRAGA